MKNLGITGISMRKLLLLFLFVPTLVIAEDSNIWLNPYAVTGMTYYQLEYGAGENVSAITDNVKLSENIPFIGLGTTAIYKRLSFDVSFITSAELGGSIGRSGFYEDPKAGTIFYDRDIDLKRKSLNLSLGYELFQSKKESIVIFGGYKINETSYNWIDAEYQQSRNGRNDIAGNPSKNNTFDTDGYFLGVSYSRATSIFGHKGRFGITLSYADLDGELEANRIHKGGADSEFTTLRDRTRYEKVISDTKGWSIGVNWAAGLPFLGKNWSYSVFIERVSYDFDAKSGYFTDTFFSNGYTHDLLDLDSYNAKESIFSFNLSISYVFNL